jgi:hypothetical protein
MDEVLGAQVQTWLQAYGQLLGVVVGAAIAGTVAIVVGVRNNKSNDARMERQIAADQVRERSRVRRERLEELHVLAGDWLMSLDKYTMLGLRLVSGNLAYRDYLNMQIEEGKSTRFQFTRLKMLLDVYSTPAVAEAYRAVDQARASYNKEFYTIERRFKGSQSRPSIDDATYDRIDGLSGQVHDAGVVLLRSIATAAAEV